jgi:hypothetical protein
LRAPSVEARSSDDLGRFRFVALPRLTPFPDPAPAPRKVVLSVAIEELPALHGSIGPPLAFQDRFRQTPLDVPDPVSHRGCAAIRPLSRGPQVMLSDFAPLSGREPMSA